jgi:hypothetical protein
VSLRTWISAPFSRSFSVTCARHGDQVRHDLGVRLELREGVANEPVDVAPVDLREPLRQHVDLPLQSGLGLDQPAGAEPLPVGLVYDASGCCCVVDRPPW